MNEDQQGRSAWLDILAYNCGGEINEILQTSGVKEKLRTEDGSGWVRPVRWIKSYQTNSMRVQRTDQGR